MGQALPAFCFAQSAAGKSNDMLSTLIVVVTWLRSCGNVCLISYFYMSQELYFSSINTAAGGDPIQSTFVYSNYLYVNDRNKCTSGMFMQSHAVSCNFMKKHAMSCKVLQSHAR